MKIFRIKDSSGNVHFGTWRADGSTAPVTGSLESGWQITSGSLPEGELMAPLDPVAIIGIAQNYREHAAEMNSRPFQYPVYFTKLPWNIQAPDQPILLPQTLRSEKVDFEGELAVIIGKTCKNVKPGEAMSVIAGYTIANDVTARDWQKEWGGGQFCRGKSFDTFCPIGPCMVTADELTDPHSLRIVTTVNGEVMQDGNTSDLIFDVPALISFLSGSTTLLPGTLILTGTPAGVGMARIPPLYLNQGDSVSISIDGIGTLTNSVCLEPQG